MFTAEWLQAVGTVITAVAVLVATIKAAKTAKEVKADVSQVHDEVRTGNGITIAGLVDLAEGRRIRVEIKPEDRTKSEQAYVDGLERAEDELSHQPKDKQPKSKE